MVTTRRATRSTKVGPRTTLVQRTTKSGKTSNSFRTRIRNGPNSWITKTMGPRGESSTNSISSGGATFSTTTRQSHVKYTAHKTPKAYKSTSSLSKTVGSGGNFILVLFVGLIAWLFSLIFGSSEDTQS